MLIALLITALIQSSPANGKNWERAKPEDVGYSSKRLDVLKAYLATIDTTGMVAVRNGKVIFEYGDVTSQSNLASVRNTNPNGGDDLWAGVPRRSAATSEFVLRATVPVVAC